MDISERVKRELEERGISIYAAAKRCDIKYELLRRTLVGKRKFLAEEFMLILERCDIDFEKMKE